MVVNSGLALHIGRPGVPAAFGGYLIISID